MVITIGSRVCVTDITDGSRYNGTVMYAIPGGWAIQYDYPVLTAEVPLSWITEGECVIATPANIVATNMIAYGCGPAPCGICAYITWQNTGGQAGIFKRGTIIDGLLYEDPTVITLNPGQIWTDTICPAIFGAGSHSVCPSPGGVSCQTVTATPPACVPNWQCEQPLNGYESDGCGNRRTNSACNPPPPITTYTINIYAYDVNTSIGIQGVLIQVIDSQQMTQQAITDINGLATFVVNEGPIVTTMSSPGFNTYRITENITSDRTLNNPLSYGMVGCFVVPITVDKISASVGEIITLTATYPYVVTVEFRDQNNVFIGRCQTYGGCSVAWDTTGLSPGTYTINSIVSGCYTSPNADPSCDCVTTNPIIITLSPVLVTGSLRFITTPPGADIYFDDVSPVLMGTSDLSTGILNISNLQDGQIVNYIIRKSGYQDKIDTVTVSGNAIINVPVTLTLVQQAGLGMIMIAGLAVGALYLVTKGEIPSSKYR